ncbi:cyclic nucleotide-binding domain-containing protein 2-like isoform X1 [Mya arenaria]|uniref:cyclic nucleotide-binding domain-containing protein 2-like isoform X1 n=1 Tax=Mya arenaria TaxID=6604 RepID=UPI0022E511CB|nr:cyclic nucleotide-binding domain-containing protein 2-like isoform X1 [Mya arenaria]
MSSKNDPDATDLDYYSKPENYTGSNLQALQKFKSDKNKADSASKKKEKKKIVKDAKYYFFHQYKHILKDVIFIDDLIDRERDPDSEDESGDEDVAATDAKSTTADGLHPIYEDEGHIPIDGKSHGSCSNDTFSPGHGPHATASGTDELCVTPDSGGFGTPGGKKRNMLTPSPSGRQSTAIQKVVAKEYRRKQLRDKFITCIKSVKAVCRLSASAKNKADTIKRQTDMPGMRTFMDIANEESTTEENMKNAGLSFDPNYFKAIREISLSSETKNILTTSPDRRTPEHVQTAMFGLQCLRSYAEYPLHMQEKLAKVAWYEVVAPKRIIIRQGHFAENFYFILSGHAVVTILLKNPKTGATFVKTATIMKKGMSFGELALLHHSKRTATVTSQDTVQLLSIGREDFFDIFMSVDGDDNMPHHIRFVSNLDFMKDWPIEELIEHPEHCLLHFFKRNTTIVANSNNSEWLYIVKSGSCVVIKKLKGVTAQATRAKPKVNDDDFLPPKVKAIVFAPKVDSGLRSKPNSTKEEDKDKKEEGSDNTQTKFSREAYSKNPATKPAHFSSKSSFAKRKNYELPPVCVPKKPEVDPEALAPPKPGPVFVQVAIMKPRDVFGLDSLRFEGDVQRAHTSVSLVSRGAECIMLSKDFFVKHVNTAVRMRHRETVQQYPEEKIFQDNLQIKEDWTAYRKVLLNDITSRIKENSNRFMS